MRDNNPADARLSRRSLLAGGTALSLSALAVAKAGSASGATGLASAVEAAHLTLGYRPSQPTGWPGTPGATFGETIGGHTVAEDFTFNGKRHRISLLPSVASGDAFDPVYEDAPADPDIDFKGTLAAAFGVHYSFHYLGGFKGHGEGRGEFDVQSYSIFADETSDTSPGTSFGGGVYVVYHPDLRSCDPAADDSLQWIQVVRQVGDGVPPGSIVDNIGRANPYYVYGGLTSINGAKVFNFHDVPQGTVQGAVPLDILFVAEVFLAQETGIKDAAGKEIVKVFGGLKYGWQVRELGSSRR
jgi:hypothetical protein